MYIFRIYPGADVGRKEEKEREGARREESELPTLNDDSFVGVPLHNQ